MIHQITYKDNNGDVVDVQYFCNPLCVALWSVRNVAKGNDKKLFDAIPTHPETDYDVHCSGCKELLWKGIEG